MKNIRTALKIPAEGEKPQPGYHKIQCHMIFDIKMEDFRSKARLVAGSHVKEPPVTITYVSVAFRDTVSIALTVATLNGLQARTASSKMIIYNHQ